jgi:hypothetical protein
MLYVFCVLWDLCRERERAQENYSNSSWLMEFLKFAMDTGLLRVLRHCALLRCVTRRDLGSSLPKLKRIF